MRFNFERFFKNTLEDLVDALNRFGHDVEDALESVPENERLTHDVELDFSSPGAVPGITSEAVTIDGVELGDTVLVGASIAVPAGFLPPRAAVTAANTVTVYWSQLTGAAADPDGAGATYTLDIWRH